uniref:Uncharacterized protein n=1 Tax=Petromyzon marinus TaxID=7757 RepID=S4R5F3_PETMA
PPSSSSSSLSACPSPSPRTHARVADGQPSPPWSFDQPYGPYLSQIAAPALHTNAGLSPSRAVGIADVFAVLCRGVGGSELGPFGDPRQFASLSYLPDPSRNTDPRMHYSGPLSVYSTQQVGPGSLGLPVPARYAYLPPPYPAHTPPHSHQSSPFTGSSPFLYYGHSGGPTYSLSVMAGDERQSAGGRMVAMGVGMGVGAGDSVLLTPGLSSPDGDTADGGDGSSSSSPSNANSLADAVPSRLEPESVWRPY